MDSLPKTQKAVSCSAGKVRLVDIPVVAPGPEEILVKNVAVASNPKDWKMTEYWGGDGYDCVEGNDVAGTVAAVGDKVTRWKVGDKVAGFSKMATKDNKYGAFAQYTVVPSWTTYQIPDNISFEEAATLPLAILTSAIALGSRDKGLGLPTPMKPATNESQRESVLINGASSSTGSFAVQLAKLANLKVIGIAGKSHSYAKKLGADIIIDYRGKSPQDLIDEIQSHGPIHYIYDCVSTKDSITTMVKALKPYEGKFAYIIWDVISDEELKELCGDSVIPKMVFVGASHDSEREFADNLMKHTTEVLKQGKLKPNNVHLLSKGLESVSEGFDLLKNNKLSAEKVVYRISDTPALKD